MHINHRRNFVQNYCDRPWYLSPASKGLLKHDSNKAMRVEVRKLLNKIEREGIDVDDVVFPTSKDVNDVWFYD